MFLSVLGLHGVSSLWKNLRLRREKKADDSADVGRRKPHILTVLMQAALFYIGCYFGYRYGVFSRELISPLYIGMGLIAGHMVFGVSLLMTHREWREVWSYFFDFSSLWNFSMESPLVLTRFVSVAVAEEIIYRVAAQPLLIELTGSTWAGIAIVVGLFCVVHTHFFVNSFVVSLEFIAFAVLVGVLYWWTGSLILVIVIHAVRNIEISHLEYLIRLDELGDEEKAMAETERALLPNRPEGV